MADSKRLQALGELFGEFFDFDDQGQVKDVDIGSFEDKTLEIYGLTRDTVDTVREMDRDLEENYGRFAVPGAVSAFKSDDNLGLVEHRIGILGRDYGIEAVRPKSKDGRITRSNFRAGISIYNRSGSNDFLDDVLDQAEGLWGEFADE